MNLFVGNLSVETTDADLRTAFSEFGELVSVRVLKDNETGISRGFGFVEMAEKFMAYDAIDNLDCTFMKGNIISVKEAKPKTTDRSKPSFGSGPRKPYSKPSYPPRRDPNRL